MTLSQRANGLTLVAGSPVGNSRLTRFEEMQSSDAGTLEAQPRATLRFDRP